MGSSSAAAGQAVHVVVGREGSLVVEDKEGIPGSQAVDEGTGQDKAQGSPA